MTLEQLRKEAGDARESADEANRILQKAVTDVRVAIPAAGLYPNITEIKERFGLTDKEQAFFDATMRALEAGRALLAAELEELRQRDEESQRAKEDADIGTDLDRSPHTHHHADVKTYPPPTQA